METEQARRDRLAYHKQWRKDHPAYMRNWRRLHPTYGKEWRAANRLRIRENQRYRHILARLKKIDEKLDKLLLRTDPGSPSEHSPERNYGPIEYSGS